MTDAEIELLKQLEQDIRELEKEQKALQNQIQALLSSNLLTTTALLQFLNYSHPRTEEARMLKTSLNSLTGLKTSIDRRLDSRRVG